MNQISNGVIIGLGVEAAIAIILPIALLIVWKVKEKCKVMPAIVGAVIFVVFALGLEGIPKYFFFVGSNGVSEYILNHAWAYTVMGCLLAGVFEEVGRFVAFKFCLKKHDAKETAITYGIGHGGIEAIIILGMTAISYVVLAMMVNNGMIDTVIEGYTQEQVQALTDQVNGIAAMGVGSIILGLLERVFAITLHISLSIVVFMGVKQKGKGWMVLLAIILHALFDVPAALYQFGVVGLVTCEVVLAVEAVAFAILGYKIYQQME